ncbi:hypothetical protein ACFYY2_33660 [Streptomyces sp. NPDC001822]|uniref:hypothetical protein n=1 Tax=Streptomyces sp. NPDC001822 TaxID=3364614 RepID=UPI003690F84E
MCGPNQLTVHIAVDGAVAGWVDAGTGRRHGKNLGPVGRALSAVGFPTTGADEPSGEAAALTPDERVALALREATGIQLEDDYFEGTWLGSVSTTAA